MTTDNTSSCSPKACQICKEDRINIGKTYKDISPLRRFFGVMFIYLPIVFFPLVILIAAMTSLSLRILGASNLKTYRDFIPEVSSHRYKFGEQVVMEPGGPQIHLGWKVFWQFNCSLYCPLSVGLFSYLAYLVKAVENWWCPFDHSKKSEYACAPLDASYWHVKPGEVGKLNTDDRDNPIWNEDS